MVPQQPNATSDSEACYIIKQKQPRGAVEVGIMDTRLRERESRGVLVLVVGDPKCWLQQNKLQMGNSLSSFDWTYMRIHEGAE